MMKERTGILFLGIFFLNVILISAFCYYFDKPLFVNIITRNLDILYFLLVILFYSLWYVGLQYVLYRYDIHQLLVRILIFIIKLNSIFLIVGYIESRSHPYLSADYLYYYKCVGNSCIYLVVLNLTTLITQFFIPKSMLGGGAGTDGSVVK